MTNGKSNEISSGTTNGTPNGAPINWRTGDVVDAALRVHRLLGPGLLESAYVACLMRELLSRGARVQHQVPLQLYYDGVYVDVGYRLDLLVDDKIVVEVKAISKVLPIHHAQLLSYLKLGKCPVGLLINFHERFLKDGLRRVVNSR